ncbi:MAG: FAD-dependent oxidoreductase [Bacteroidetes bacterium HGW-Bacteroidetes-16]|jgi:glycerol-3-phosphate dehydrogenase|nr:MAG: FAD-dependent oxidoreductase [Bacteroidetes bacterium HGW-Bacteroidetes-16]
MERNNMISEIEVSEQQWDIAIIGGGATGVGAALETASRGYKVVLVEQSDFGKATSGRSTKLAHGGVRYLQQGNVPLVMEALRERGVMRRNAPHLVHDLPFVVPVYDWWEGPFYGIGLKLYDMLAGKEGFGPSKNLNKEETLRFLPTIETEGLRGGVIYHDGQFDDSRLLINLVQTAVEQGATMLNYVKAVSLIKENDRTTGVEVQDLESGRHYLLKSKVVINATGVFADVVRKMDDPKSKDMMTSSQGVHLVLDYSFLPGSTGIMVPHTDDGRVLFAVPWYNRTLVGTTDTFVKEYPLEPVALESEIDFLLTHAARYLSKDPKRSDVKSVFAGLRPLVLDIKKEEDTSSISRDHSITTSMSGLISIAGGKWTTYRKMAEDVIGQAIDKAGLPKSDSVTENLQIHGCHHHSQIFGSLGRYGSDARQIKNLLAEESFYRQRLHPEHEIVVGEIIWAVRHEMARTVEDFLSRRTRLLILDARASIEVAPVVAKLMAKELNQNRKWVKDQIQAFTVLAKNYVPG